MVLELPDESTQVTVIVFAPIASGTVLPLDLSHVTGPGMSSTTEYVSVSDEAEVMVPSRGFVMVTVGGVVSAIWIVNDTVAELPARSLHETAITFAPSVSGIVLPFAGEQLGDGSTLSVTA